MKKAILILICLTFLWVTASCDKSKMSLETSSNDNSTDEIQSIQKASDNGSGQQENDNSIDNITEDSSVNYSDFNHLPQNYLQVIKNEKTFIFMGEEVLIDNYKSPYLQKYLTQCDNAQYAVLDMDGDGKEECLISGWTRDILVLHEENGIIYGFDFTFREMYSVRTDGSYYWNTNQGNTYGCSKLSFKNGTCSNVELSRTELDNNGVANFFINGVRVAKDKYNLFAESLSNVDNVTWYKLSIFSKNIEDNDSIQTKQYQYFYRSVEENPYDKWLKNELEKGERAENTIYAEYLAFWKDELAFTIESGEVIFDDKEQYEQWKSDIQQWLVISQDILKNEMNMMNYSLGQLEVIIPYCEMVRQKAIDAKRFIYYYQIYNTLTPYTNIEINWCSK